MAAPKAGVVPKIRIGTSWISVLWALPAGFVLVVLGVAVAQALRELPAALCGLVVRCKTLGVFLR